MNGKTYAYLDLAALPAVGMALLDPAPAWVFRGDGSGILWANTDGAVFLGASKMGALLETRFGGSNPIVKQIARLARVLPTEAPRFEILRFSSGFSLKTLPAACRRINLADGTSAVLAIGVGPTAAGSFTARAERLADMIAGDDCLVAIIESEGRIVAASGGFQELAPASSEIDDLVEEVSDGAARILKRPIPIGGRNRPAGIARFATTEGDFALLIVGPEETIEAAQPTTTEPQAADTPAGQSMEAISPSASSPMPLSFAPVIRFVWRSDAQHRLVFVSEELRNALGEAPSAILGHSWTEIAERLFPDARPALSEAFDSHGQWGGLKVYWPAEGRPFRMATEISAFPMAERGSFGGYRGFGLIHPDDRIALVPAPLRDDDAPAIDAAIKEIPEETLSPAAQPDEKVGSSEEPAASLLAEGEPSPPIAPIVEARAAPDIARSNPSNVVRLPGSGAIRPVRDRLTGTEQDAFRRIAEALGIRTEGDAIAAPATGETRAPPEKPAEAEQRVEEPDVTSGFDLKLLDRLPIGVVIFRGETTLFASKTLLDLLGYETQDSFAAAGGSTAIFPDQEAGWVSSDLQRSERDLAARRKDGSRVAVEARLQAVPFGAATALMLSLRELPPRRERESPQDRLIEEIAAIEARVDELQTILDTATDGVIVIDGGGRIVNVNRSAEALFGIEANEVLGASFTDLLAEESHKGALDYLDGLAANGVASVLNDGREVIGKVPQGGLIPLFMTMGSLGGRLGETGKFCAVLRDITQWKNAEEELVAARRAAEAANAQKSDFLAKISHEIRTPLNAIIGFSEVMMEERFGPIGSQRYRDYLRDIHVSGSHLMSLINDLLDLSKIEAGKLELAFESVAVNETIQECVALMQPQANRARIIIRTSLAAGVPNIVADPRSLRQILLNLLSNAVKFTQAGGQVIVSSASEDSGEVVIRIRDTGVGMSTKDIETALKPFRQISTSGRARGEGTGLGLPLTKALVEANRASFAIDSAVDQGTLIKISFPNSRVLAG